MHRVAIIARLKDGREPEAAKLLAEGPPFDAEERGLDSHAVYLSAGEVVFVFEGPDVDVVVGDMVDSPFEPTVKAALGTWRPLIEGQPRIGRLAYQWSRGE
jgi:hypothetical protein